MQFNLQRSCNNCIIRYELNALDTNNVICAPFDQHEVHVLIHCLEVDLRAYGQMSDQSILRKERHATGNNLMS